MYIYIYMYFYMCIYIYIYIYLYMNICMPFRSKVLGPKHWKCLEFKVNLKEPPKPCSLGYRYSGPLG